MEKLSEFARRLEAFFESQTGAGVARPTAPSPERMHAYLARGFGRAVDSAKGSHLRAHQVEVMAATATHVAQRAPQTICVAPTGSGKTEIFQNLIAGTCRRSKRTGRLLVPNTVILVPTQVLVRQTVQRFEKYYPDLPTGYYSSNHGDTFGPICVATYHGFVQGVLQGSITPEDVDHLVLDEAHRALSELRRDVFGRFIGTVLVSAYTASPVFDLTKHLYSLLGVENTVARISMKRMIDEKVLAPVVNYILRIRLDGELPSDPKLRGAVLSHVSAETACGFFLKNRHDMPGVALSERSFLGYTRGITEAHAAAEIFGRSAKKKVGALSGRDGRVEQYDLLDRLSSGDLSGIFNARLLIEGTDLPRVNLILNLAPTNSLVNQLQRCGRGLRIDPDLDVDDLSQTAAIVDIAFVVNGQPVGRPRFFFEAVGEEAVARLVDAPPRQIQDVLADLSDAERSGSTLQDVDNDGLDATDAVSDESDPYEVDEGDEPFIGDDVKSRPVDGFEVDADVASVQFFLRTLDVRPDRKWMTKAEVQIRLGTSSENARFADVWTELVRMARSGRAVLIEGRSVKFELQRSRRGSGTAFLHEDEIEWLGDRIGLKTAIPDKTEDWVSMSGVLSTLGFSHRFLAPRWERMTAQAGEDGIVRLPEGLVRFELRRSRSAAIHHVHKDDLDILRRHLRPVGNEAAKTQDWLSQGEAAASIGFSITPRIRDLWKDLTQAAINGEPYKNKKVRFERRWDFNRVAWYLHVDERNWLAAELGRDRRYDGKTSEWIGRSDLARLYGISPSVQEYSIAWVKLLVQYDKTGVIMLDGLPARAERRSSGSRTPFCIHESEVERFKPHLVGQYLSVASAGLDWIAISRVPARLGVSLSHRGFADLARRLGDLASEDERTHRGIRFAIRRTSVESLCVHSGTLHAFASAIGSTWPPADAKDSAWLGKTEVLTRLGLAVNNVGFEQIWSSIPLAKDDGPEPVRVLKRSAAGTFPCVHERHMPAIVALASHLCEGERLTDEWFTHSRADQERDDFPGVYTLLLAAYGELKRQLEGGLPTQVQGNPIRAELRRGGNKGLVVAVHADSIPLLMSTLKSFGPRHPPKTDDWLAIREVGMALGIGLPAQLKELWATLSEQEADESEVEFGPVTVRCANRTSALRKPVVCLHRDDLLKFGSLIQNPKDIPLKGDDWLTSSEVAQRLGRQALVGTEIHAILADLRAGFASAGVALLPDGTPISMEQRRTGPKTTAACISSLDVEKIRAQLDPKNSEIYPLKNEDLMTFREVCGRIGRGDANPIAIEIWKRVTEAASSGEACLFGNAKIEPVIALSGSKKVICISVGDVDTFERIFDQLKDNQSRPGP